MFAFIAVSNCLHIYYFLVDENCAALVKHLYGAGTDTTANALKWSLLYMCQHPQIREKVQAEIDEVIGEVALAQQELLITEQRDIAV